MNPMQMNKNRTARLVAEAITPVYSTSTATAAMKAEMRLLSDAERAGCTEDYCFVCSRATEHFGEHSDEQLLTFARSPRGKMMIARRG